MMSIRRANERGYADHGWLKSFHSFSFAEYLDPKFMGFGPLRVINEDRVAPGMGFGTHGHRDSMGNGSVIRPGDVQRMSAGRGVMHSEFNHAKTETTHFLQIWIQPDRTGIDPSYEEKRFEATDKRGRLRLVASPDGAEGSVVIHQNARVYAGTFDGDETAVLQVGAGRRVYIHVARGDVAVNGQKLGAGDAVMLTDEPSAVLANGRAAEVLAFDLP